MAHGKYIPQLKPAELQFSMEKLQIKFEDYGKIVKEAVEKRTELHRLLDIQQQKIADLHVQDTDNRLSFLDDKDPLRFIESDYPFFQDEAECTLADVSNVENPRRCIEAMESFVTVVHANIHRFKHLPLGPLYKNVTVQDNQWAPIVEYVLRPYLFTFLVDNIVDGLVLDELISQHFPNSRPGFPNSLGVVCPKHFIFSFQSPYEIGPRMTGISGLEIENMLEISHFDFETWAKFLSMKIHIEKIIFMENENVAFLVMSNITRTPWHCKTAYTLDGFVVDPFPCFRTRKMRFRPRTVYLKCAKSMGIGELNMKVRKTKQMIATINGEIHKIRVRQLKVADRIDKMRRLISEAEHGQSSEDSPGEDLVKPKFSTLKLANAI